MPAPFVSKKKKELPPTKHSRTNVQLLNTHTQSGSLLQYHATIIIIVPDAIHSVTIDPLYVIWLHYKYCDCPSGSILNPLWYRRVNQSPTTTSTATTGLWYSELVQGRRNGALVETLLMYAAAAKRAEKHRTLARFLELIRSYNVYWVVIIGDLFTT